MDELIEKIIFSDDLTSEQKSNLIMRVLNASHGIEKFLAEGYYLRSKKNEETNSIDIQLWYRNVDPSGMTHNGNTNYNVDAILEFMKQTCITNSLKK